MRRFLPELIGLVLNRKIDPGKVFDLTLPLSNPGGGGLPRDGRAPRHQGAAASLKLITATGFQKGAGNDRVAETTEQDRRGR